MDDIYQAMRAKGISHEEAIQALSDPKYVQNLLEIKRSNLFKPSEKEVNAPSSNPQATKEKKDDKKTKPVSRPRSSQPEKASPQKPLIPAEREEAESKKSGHLVITVPSHHEEEETSHKVLHYLKKSAERLCELAEKHPILLQVGIAGIQAVLGGPIKALFVMAKDIAIGDLTEKIHETAVKLAVDVFHLPEDKVDLGARCLEFGFSLIASTGPHMVKSARL